MHSVWWHIIQLLTKTAGLCNEGTSSGYVVISLVQRLYAVKIRPFARFGSINVLTRRLDKRQQCVLILCTRSGLVFARAFLHSHRVELF